MSIINVLDAVFLLFNYYNTLHCVTVSNTVRHLSKQQRINIC